MIVESRLLSLTILLVLLPTPCLADFSGRVVGISDGDTIKVLHNGKSEKIRLNVPRAVCPPVYYFLEFH